MLSDIWTFMANDYDVRIAEVNPSERARPSCSSRSSIAAPLSNLLGLIADPEGDDVTLFVARWASSH